MKRTAPAYAEELYPWKQEAVPCIAAESAGLRATTQHSAVPTGAQRVYLCVPVLTSLVGRLWLLPTCTYNKR